MTLLLPIRRTARDLCAIAVGVVTIAFAPTALAQDDDAAADANGSAVEAEDGGVSYNVDLELASAYVWRGINVLGEKQGTSTPVAFPSFSVAVGDLGFGYWGAFQLAGEPGPRDNDAAGFNSEQDLFISYDFDINPPDEDEDDPEPVGASGLSLGLTYYFYPMVILEDGNEVADMPMYIEPAASLSFSSLGGIDLGLGVSYFKGLRPSGAEDLDHVYINPSVGKEFALNDTMGVGVGISAGYKALTEEVGQDDSDANGGYFDVKIDASLSMSFGSVYVVPAAHFSWINKHAPEIDGVVTDKDPDTVTIWGSVNIGSDF